jgi:hypothetical protein
LQILGNRQGDIAIKFGQKPFSASNTFGIRLMLVPKCVNLSVGKKRPHDMRGKV